MPKSFFVASSLASMKSLIESLLSQPIRKLTSITCPSTKKVKVGGITISKERTLSSVTYLRVSYF
jgi:hypothetical protein